MTATDQILARNNPHLFGDPAAIDDTYDFDRDKRVNATDQIIARNNAAFFFNALRLITAPEAEKKGLGPAYAGGLNSPDILPADLAWLSEYNPGSPANERTTKQEPPTAMIDRLLEAYWPVLRAP